jgi:hypothetical protein
MRYGTARIDELERLSAFGEEGVWRPIRHHFGIEGFGINAYTGDQVGDRVIEEHTEMGAASEELGRHQELYIVLTGRAAFTLDGEEVDAPAGTLVFVGQPDVVRGALASEPGTTVIAIGARPGIPFEVQPWEYSFRARAVGGREAYEVMDEAAERYPDNWTIPYNRAGLHASDGDREAALASLRRAVELRPDVRRRAAADDDFGSLRGDAEFDELIAD